MANLLYWVIWACLVTQILNDNSNLKKSLKFICFRQKIKFIFTFFLRYYKDLVNKFTRSL